MAKECGLSDLTQKLDDGINSAMDSVQNSIVGDAAGGVGVPEGSGPYCFTRASNNCCSFPTYFPNRASACPAFSGA